MRSKIALFFLALAAGCRGVEESDRWLYERVLHEQTPAVQSQEDAVKRSQDLREKTELTLDECHRLAVQRSETLALDGEELVRIQTQYEQAVGTLLPRLGFAGSYARQDDRGVTSSSNVQRSFTLSERTEYKFTARQPIFSGLREFYALRQGSFLYDAREFDLRHARMLLYIDAADAFYAVLQLEREVATTGDALRLAEGRLEELVQRNLVGITRRSEVLAQEAETAFTRAFLERLRGSLTVAWEALKFLTGLPATRKLAETPGAPGELSPLAFYINRALALRNDLRSLQNRALAADERVGVARAGYFPTVSLDANYYTHREGISKEIDWDLMLSVDVPIFEGAITQAKMREARSHIRSANLELERRRRSIELEVSRSYESVKTLHGEIVSLEKAVSSATESHELVQAEYRQGIATNVEVLTAFNALQQSLLGRDRAVFQVRLAVVRLEVQSGQLPGGGK